MECRRCGSSLDRPGDYCLVCRSDNADAVVLELDRERARVTTLVEERVVGAREVTTTPEDGDEAGVVELRNFAGLVADEVRR
ncbi:metal-binding protein, partial [Halobacteriales archaeon QH_3_68_24]